ncbi:unnamed protein product [Rotaria sp. Silwood2]|nr:unnamed protein product [Rotaria sp. Silwood2]
MERLTMWNDYNLRWKPEEFGNIQTLRIPSTQIWVPDILLYNSADDKFDAAMKVNAVVQHNGDILYVPPVLFKSTCPFDIVAFPFVSIKTMFQLYRTFILNVCLFLDTQHCTLKFGSWTYDDAVPCFLISCMILLGILLPPNSGDKINLQITTLLTVVMFSLRLSEIIPPNSNAIPVITIYFMCVMITSAFSVVASVLVLSLHFRNSKSHKMPLWVRKYICNYLAWLLLMKRPDHNLSWRGIGRRWASPKQESSNINGLIDNHHSKIASEPLLNNTFELLSTNLMNIDRKAFELLENREKQGSHSLLEFTVPLTTKIHGFRHRYNRSKELEMIRSELRIIISQLTILTSYSQKEEREDDEAEEWKFMARVIDRLCLVCFAVAMILFTVFTFFNVELSF